MKDTEYFDVTVGLYKIDDAVMSVKEHSDFAVNYFFETVTKSRVPF